MRIFNLHLQAHGAVAEYRHFMPSRALIRAGHDVIFFQDEEAPQDMIRYLSDHSKDFDLMHIGYAAQEGPIKLFAMARNYAQVPFVTDVDDNIYDVPAYNFAFSQYNRSATERRLTRMQLRISDGVSLTTDALLAVTKNDCKQVAILPNCIDPASWEHPIDPARADDKSVRLMIAGSLGHYDDYLEARDSIEWAMDKYDGTNGKPLLRIFFFGYIPDWAERWYPDNRNSHNNRLFFVQATYVHSYRRVMRWLAPDILLAPLACNAFNATKSHIKAYDAAMCDSTLLCTDFTPYSTLPDECCIKVSNTMTQWREGLSALVTDAALRRRLHSRLKEHVLDVWPIDKHIHKWVEFYQRVREAPLVNSLEDVVRPA